MRRVAIVSLLAALAAGGAQTQTPFIAVIHDFTRVLVDPSSLDRGEAFVRIVPGRDREFGVVAATQVHASPQQLVSLVTRLAHLPHGDCVVAAGRFSDPPVPEDLAAMPLPPGDLDDLSACRPGRCDLKLSDHEIVQVQNVIRGARADWRTAAERAMKTIMLERLREFRRLGHRGLRPLHDKSSQTSLDAEFGALLSATTYLGGDTAAVVDYLRRFPHGIGQPAIEFYYWSVDALGLKPVVSVTRVSVFRLRAGGDDDALIVSTQVFATHYLTASLSMMTIGRSAGPEPSAVVYANRSRADGLHGLFGGFVRRKVEGRIRAGAPGALASLRLRLEGHHPASTTCSAR